MGAGARSTRGNQQSSDAQPRILIADDEADIREALRFVLEDEGYVVVEAADGIEALDVMTLSPTPLLVLLDLVMPRLSGFRVLQHASTDPHLMTRHAYLVLTAAHLTPIRMAPGFAELVSAYHIAMIAKPFDLEELLATVACLYEQLTTGQDGDSDASRAQETTHANRRQGRAVQ